MNTIVIATALLLSNTTPNPSSLNWVPEKLFVKDQYLFKSEKTTGTQAVIFSRVFDQATITLTYSVKSGRPQETKGYSEPISQVRESYQSTYPLCVTSRLMSKPGYLELGASTNFEYVNGKIMAEIEPEPQPGSRLRLPKPIDMIGDQTLLEEFVREAIARAASSRMSYSETYQRNQLEYQSRVCQKSGTRFFLAADVVRNLGATSIPSTDGLTIAFRHQDRDVLFVAGANEFRLGNRWIKLPDTTFLDSGELWVPTTVLDHLE